MCKEICSRIQFPSAKHVVQQHIHILLLEVRPKSIKLFYLLYAKSLRLTNNCKLSSLTQCHDNSTLCKNWGKNSAPWIQFRCVKAQTTLNHHVPYYLLKYGFKFWWSTMCLRFLNWEHTLPGSSGLFCFLLTICTFVLVSALSELSTPDEETGTRYETK